MRDSVTDELQVELAELQRLVAAQAYEIAALRADVRRIEGCAAAKVDVSPTPDLPPKKTARGWGRRLPAVASPASA